MVIMVQKRGFDILRFIKIIGAIIGLLVSLMIFVFVAFVFMSFASLFLAEPDLVFDGNVALIPIKGTISTTGSKDIWSSSGVKSEKIVEWIKEAEKNDAIKAIMLNIDSGGGTPVGTAEIADAVKTAKKPTVAVIHEIGASGAYWVASASDVIFANRLSTVGSIGVRASYLEFAGLMHDYNVTYRRLVAGKYKDIKSPFKEMSPAEQKLVQDKLDRLHNIFIHEVAANRGLDVEHVRELATGYVFLGVEAKEKGLIDFIGTNEDAKDYIAKELNITVTFKKFKEKTGFFEAISSGMSSYSYKIGQGMGSVLIGSTEDNNVELLV
jgi:protease-4